MHAIRILFKHVQFIVFFQIASTMIHLNLLLFFSFVSVGNFLGNWKIEKLTTKSSINPLFMELGIPADVFFFFLRINWRLIVWNWMCVAFTSIHFTHGRQSSESYR